jgi:hypothetical protein
MLNDPPNLEQSSGYVWPPDTAHYDMWMKPPTPNVYPMQRVNQVTIVEASLLSGHTAFDFQDPGQILTQTLVTKNVVAPDYYAALMDVYDLRDAIARSYGVETHYRSG